jgi:hypothetical protein
VSLVPLIITHAGGVRCIPFYSMPEMQQRFANTVTTTRGASWARRDGDARPVPDRVVFDAVITAANLAAAYALAETVAQEARTATGVESNAGAVGISSLAAWRAEPDVDRVRLRLEFFPNAAAFAHPVSFDTTAFTMDTIEFTMDADRPFGCYATFETTLTTNPVTFDGDPITFDSQPIIWGGS